MLQPENRTLLADMLVPPAGFRLVHAVATTFTLDLTALLSVPLGFAGMDLDEAADPLSVMQAVRAHAERITVFCQAGMVKVPSKHSDLLAFLERIVHQVPPRSNGIFHPKIWVLRFRDEAGDERLRVTCGSRNLTNDRAWDAVVVLEGFRGGRPRAVNARLADFVRSLPRRASTVDDAQLAAIEALAEALRYTEWERPEGAIGGEDWLTFHIFGPETRSRLDLSGRRRLLISPFVEDKGLELLWPDAEGECTLVSREEELDALGPATRDRLSNNGGSARVLNSNAWIPDADSEESGVRYELSGLHAKVYVVERGRTTHVFLGSANATAAAFRGNDEILVELVGSTAAFGIDAVLGRNDTGFGRLLLSHEFAEPDEPDAKEDLRRRLERALCDLAVVPLVAMVGSSAPESYFLILRSEMPLRPVPDGAELFLEPLTLGGQGRLAGDHEPFDERWELAGIEEITPFVALRLVVGSGSSRVEASGVTIAKLVGDVEDRLHRVLARRLGSPEEFLRFLLLLLELAGKGEFLAGNAESGASFGRFRVGESGAGVLEALVEALANSPSTIDDLERLVGHLDPRVLPAGWKEVWDAVLEARQLLESKA